MSIVVLHALTQEFDAGGLASAARSASPVPLRRAGALAELCIVGVHACLERHTDTAPPAALLWGSHGGIRAPSARVIGDLCLQGEAPMPFDFLATQPALVAVALQKSLPALIHAVYQPWHNDDTLHWSRMLHLARRWILDRRYARVVCGQIEPAPGAHRGTWIVLAPGDSSAPVLAHLEAAPAHTPCLPGPTALIDWLIAGTTPVATLHGDSALPPLRFERTRRR